MHRFSRSGKTMLNVHQIIDLLNDGGIEMQFEMNPENIVNSFKKHWTAKMDNIYIMPNGDEWLLPYERTVESTKDFLTRVEKINNQNKGKIIEI